jgi:hypothetical protein
MRIIGVDLHARQQTVAMLDTETGELTEKTLVHDGDEVRNFYSALRGPVLVGIEATGSMQWFLYQFASIEAFQLSVADRRTPIELDLHRPELISDSNAVNGEKGVAI